MRRGGGGRVRTTEERDGVWRKRMKRWMPPTVWADRGSCAVVAVVWVVPFATDAGVELKLGPLAHV